MKGYTDFAMGFMGAEAIATKPIGTMKYMDWQKVQKAVDEHPNSVIYAGLMEDWNNTSGLIYANGKYYDGYVYGCSIWATPIVDVDGEEIECWTNEETKEGHRKPSWWGNGQKLLSEWDYNDEDESNDVSPMTPEEFKVKAQELYDKYNGYAGEEGHIDVDDLLTECLNSLGYKEGTEILWSMRSFWYS